MNRDYFLDIVSKSYSKSDVCKFLSWNVNGYGIKRVTKLIEDFDVDVSHFDRGKNKRIRYERIVKECPVCFSEFETLGGHRYEKTTCSQSCSNTYFRSNVNHPNWKESSYRTTCFHYHKKECIVCSEANIVTVHHYDGNKKNNHPTNLIPICPTHHQYIHSAFKYLVEDVVDKYRNEFILKFNEA
jgi:hypothetical protein